MKIEIENKYLKNEAQFSLKFWAKSAKISFSDAQNDQNDRAWQDDDFKQWMKGGGRLNLWNRLWNEEESRSIWNYLILIEKVCMRGSVTKQGEKFKIETGSLWLRNCLEIFGTSNQSKLKKLIELQGVSSFL